MRISEIKAFARLTPGFFSMVLGIACALVAFQSMRLTTLTGIYPIEPSLIIRHIFGFLAALVAYSFYKRKSDFRLGRSTRTVLLIAVFFSGCLIAKYQAYLFGFENYSVEFLGKILEEFAACFLILAWAENAIPKGLRHTLIIFSCSVIAAAIIQTVLSFFQQVPCMVALSLLPLISGAIFSSFRSAEALHEFQQVSRDNQAQDQHNNSTAENEYIVLPQVVSLLLYCIIILCFSFIVGHILYESLDIQQAISTSPLSQLCIVLGNALGGFFLLMFGDRVKSKSNLALYFLIMFACIAIAFYLTTYLTGSWVGIYLVLSSFVLQLTLALIWCAPFTSGKRTPILSRIALGYAIYFLAKTFSTSFMYAERILDISLFGIITSVILLVVLGCSIALIGNIEEPLKSASNNAEAKEKPTPFKSAITVLAAEYELTPQETNILSYVAQGRNAKSISETLVISLNTTKSHMRNLYAKLGVHSQQEIIDIVNDTVKQDSK